MRKLIITMLSVMALMGINMNAQVTVTYAMDSPTFTLAHEDTDKFEKLDSSYLTVSYQFKYRKSEKDDSLSHDDLMELQMGRHCNAFFSRNLRNFDIHNTKELKTTMQFSTIPENFVGFDLLFNHSNAMLDVTNRVPYTSQVIEYTESTPTIEWRYNSEETDSVMGYLCKAATCVYEGREWKVYYTDEIPLPYGPWKLNGAKGLILRAIDKDGDFVFEAAGLTQKPQPIIRYDWNRKKMSKSEWKQFEKNMYKNAGVFVRNTGARIIIMDNSDRGFHNLSEDWSQYYNPLEK